jgi:hypothetical protein
MTRMRVVDTRRAQERQGAEFMTRAGLVIWILFVVCTFLDAWLLARAGILF